VTVQFCNLHLVAIAHCRFVINIYCLCVNILFNLDSHKYNLARGLSSILCVRRPLHSCWFDYSRYIR